MATIDNRYSETADAVDQGRRVENLIGRYKARAALDNRVAAAMGGSTGQSDGMGWMRRNATQALRGAGERERTSVFRDNRSSLKRSDQPQAGEDPA